MTVRVEIQGRGQVAEFPDGTDPSVIDQTIKRDYFSKVGAPPPHQMVVAQPYIKPTEEVKDQEFFPSLSDYPKRMLGSFLRAWAVPQQAVLRYAKKRAEEPEGSEISQIGQSLKESLEGFSGVRPEQAFPEKFPAPLEYLDPILAAGITSVGRGIIKGLTAKGLEKTIPVARAMGEVVKAEKIPIVSGTRSITEIAKEALLPKVRPKSLEAQAVELPSKQAELLRLAKESQVGTPPPTPRFLKSAEELLEERGGVKSPTEPTPTSQPGATPQPTPTAQPQPSIPSTPSPAVPSLHTLVDETPLKIGTSATAQDLRDAYSGAKNAQALRGNYVAADVKHLIPDPIDRAALTIYRDLGGDKGKMIALFQNPKFTPYREVIQRALKLPPNALEANQLLDKYFAETGRVGQKFGFYNELIEDYINRLWGTPPKRLITSKTSLTNLSKTTPHALSRKYTTLIEGIEAGEKPLTLDAADLTTIHSTDFARVLTNNKLLNSLKDLGLSLDIKPGHKIPSGYLPIGHSNIAIPDFLAPGLRAIIEPNFLSKIDELRGFRKYQGLVKTIDLSLSLFHHFTMAMQYLYQTKFGVEAGFGTEIPKLLRLAKSDSFRDLEIFWADKGLMTSNVDANLDVMRQLSQKEGVLGKLANAPVVKQGFNLMKANNEFLFGKMQRWLKVVDASKKMTQWSAKHSNATNEEVISAARSISREINSAYGGLNWESLGKTPSFVALNRTLLLAPDWTFSNYYLFKQAITEWGTPGGAAARSHFISALIGAGIITEGLNKITTGHFTDKNAPGHAFEIEVRPGVYVSFFRGGIGDVLREGSLVKELGPIGGTAHFISGKAAPGIRTITGMMGNVTPTGKKLWSFEKNLWQNTLSTTGQLLQTSGPMPFGISQDIREIQKGETDPWSYVLSSVGIGRPGQSSAEYAAKPKKRALRERRKVTHRGPPISELTPPPNEPPQIRELEVGGGE